MSLTDYSRTLVTLVEITLPWCANSHGSAPCTATGTPCFNTYHTCADRANFSASEKTYQFCSATAPVPFPGPRPYVKSVSYLPTEITTNLTKTGRIKVEFVDEPDSDIGIDPYVTSRSAWPDIPGTFFKKLLARNPNYKGATLRILEGVLGDEYAAFVPTANVLLETGAIGKGTFTFESVDLLAGLGDIEIPVKKSLQLLLAIDASVTELTLTDTADAAGVASSGYLLIGDEVIQYSSYDLAQRRIYGCTRGAFSTTAAGHDASASVQPCRYFAPGNPYDHLLEMLLTDAAYDPALVDSVAFAAAKAWPGGEVDMSALLTEPRKLSDVYLALVDWLDCKSWVAEDLQITIRRNIANKPGREYTAWSDAATVIKSSQSSDLNETSRKTRCAVYWEKNALGKFDDIASYSRIDIGVNGDSETEYGDYQLETVYLPWLTAAGIVEETLAFYISDSLLRRMFHRRDAATLISISVDPKDGAVACGDFVTLATDEICNPDGSPVSTRFQVVRREVKGSKIDYKLLRMPVRQCCFYGPDNDALTYDTATAAEREYGGFYADDLDKNSDGTDGAYYF